MASLVYLLIMRALISFVLCPDFNRAAATSGSVTVALTGKAVGNGAGLSVVVRVVKFVKVGCFDSVPKASAASSLRLLRVFGDLHEVITCWSCEAFTLPHMMRSEYTFTRS